MRIARRLRPVVSAAAVASVVAGCMVGPDYERPDAPVPAAYAEQGWKRAEPRLVGDGDWWSIYDDPVLQSLLAAVDVSNQNLMAAEAAYRQASAIVREARAGLFPTISSSGSRTRSDGFSSRDSTASSASFSSATTGSSLSTTRFSSSGDGPDDRYSLSLDGTWTPDLWGRIRRTVEGDVAATQASAADLAAARLSARSQLATAYFQLRVADALRVVLDATAAADGRSLEIARNRFAVGVTTRADVAQAEAQVYSTQAEAINVGVQRAQLEHAIAVLAGLPPADFSLPAAPLTADVPEVPAGLPSALLERRPDIAAAERRMAEANAQIGVAEAAYYPDITLSGSLETAAGTYSNLFKAANSLWSIGASVAWTVFDFGARGARVDAATAGYEQTVAQYRQTVLTAFQEVEDQLSALRILADQAGVQDTAVAASRQAEELIRNQYKEGTVDFTSVIVAQTATLNAERNALTIVQNRLVASVALVEALGGGWDARALPTPQQARAIAPVAR